jgi:peroxiredoxin
VFALALTGPAAAGSGGVPEHVALRPLPAPDGKEVALDAPRGGVAALVFYSSECPISNAYSPTLNRLAEEFRKDKLRLVGVCVDPDRPAAEMAAHARDFGLKFPVVQDRDVALAAQLGASVTPEAFVIDDQFAARQKRNANPITRELRDAVAAVLEGREVVPAEVPAVGCPIPEPARSSARPTYAGEVAAILGKNCLECHRPGQVRPFSLATYEQARQRAGAPRTGSPAHSARPARAPLDRRRRESDA